MRFRRPPVLEETVDIDAEPGEKGIRRVEKLMGTAVVVDIRDPVDPELVESVYEWLRWVEEHFSVFRPDSEISRIGRGELHTDHASPDVRRVLIRCEELHEATEGWFQHRPPDRPDRPLDPSGLVKGWSIDEAALMLRMAGVENFVINAGGDILAQGRPDDEPWRIGIRHPDVPAASAARLSATDLAVATSGTYERGDHVWGGADGGFLRSVSVIGPELGTADALATAIFASGEAMPSWLRNFPGYDLVLMSSDERLLWTPGADGLLLRDLPSTRAEAPLAEDDRGPDHQFGR
ncbi:MAG TPA: FAD:protein FMN transferase [Acidimicrobiales bacterium]|nr:FAD:protein FMN transferase [Acidimicrobiales bacterium]